MHLAYKMHDVGLMRSRQEFSNTKVDSKIIEKKTFQRRFHRFDWSLFLPWSSLSYAFMLDSVSSLLSLGFLPLKWTGPIGEKKV